MIGLLEMCLTNMGHEIQPGMVLYDTIAAVNAVHKVYSSMQVCREGGKEGGGGGKSEGERGREERREEGGSVVSGSIFCHGLGSFSSFTLYWKLTFLKLVFL